MIGPPPRSPLFPYTTLSRSLGLGSRSGSGFLTAITGAPRVHPAGVLALPAWRTHGGQLGRTSGRMHRSEEHTSELQSRSDLVCRLLLEKKKKCKETRTLQCK